MEDNLTMLNLCNLPPWSIGSLHYNRNPQPLHIQGSEHACRKLFAQLDHIDSPEQRGMRFHDFMDVKFQLHQWQNEKSHSSRKSLKNSYLRFLRGWMFDSNSIEGAVLKGWVESRIGLVPTFHHQAIESVTSEAYFHYMYERMQGSMRTSSIFTQLDILFTYMQYELRRRSPDTTHVKLYRGIYNFSEHCKIERLGKNSYHMRLNNLNSFTADFEKAWEFGTRVIEAQIPLNKIFFLCGVLPRTLLKGEDEYMVIGGDYEVKVLLG
jgi:NAD+--dinitrogen-reductase ADP-D-ribosyltransferase